MPSYRQLVDTVERWRRLPGRERLDRGRRRFALTFDDGPDPDATPAVLDALQAGGARATFFLVGEQVEAHPELARELVARGHEPALHGFLHVEHDELGAAVRADLERGRDVLLSATGREPRFVRPPYGRFSDRSHAAARELGLVPVLWSAWGGDWEAIGAERIAELAARDLDDGAIVLLHDSARYASRPSAAPTAAALPALLDAARAARLSPVTVEEALGAVGPGGSG
ncbi:MAG: polysaccharide deacetylase family protein [Nocardioidaceae bacterium]